MRGYEGLERAWKATQEATQAKDFSKDGLEISQFKFWILIDMFDYAAKGHRMITIGLVNHISRLIQSSVGRVPFVATEHSLTIYSETGKSYRVKRS
jgi:hypothetical protein